MIATRTRRVPDVESIRRARPRQSVFRGVDLYLRRRDTWLAGGLHRVSSSVGDAYATSAVKRTLDLAVAFPALALVVPLIILLILVNKLLYPHRPALFRQRRVGRGGGTLGVTKVRSMVASSGREQGQDRAPVCSAFGRIIRKHYLDELPQLFLVLGGGLSLVGTRVLPREVYDGLRAAWSPERFEAWRAMYCRASLGLTGLHQVSRRLGKEDARRFHRDMFYARHASLGFDLYLLWRTLFTTDSAHLRAVPRADQSMGDAHRLLELRRNPVPYKG